MTLVPLYRLQARQLLRLLRARFVLRLTPVAATILIIGLVTGVTTMLPNRVICVVDRGILNIARRQGIQKSQSGFRFSPLQPRQRVRAGLP